ncbi:MAG: hypothetical protein JSR58_02560 [Verrucomicrobia bacterium]|nr:hypothetical protein [Verrucomicrobiota bacterium]
MSTSPNIRVDQYQIMASAQFSTLFDQSSSLTIPPFHAWKITDLNPLICRKWENETPFNDQLFVGEIINDLLQEKGKCLYIMGGEGYAFIPDLSKKELIIHTIANLEIQTQNLALIYTRDKIKEIFTDKDAEIIPEETEIRIPSESSLCQEIAAQTTQIARLKIVYRIFNESLKSLGKVVEPFDKANCPFVDAQIEKSTINLHFKRSSAIFLSSSSG